MSDRARALRACGHAASGSYCTRALSLTRTSARRNAELMARFADESLPVPKPPHWGGYLIRPTVVEFWQVRACSPCGRCGTLGQQ